MENFNQYCLNYKDFELWDGKVVPNLKNLIDKLDKCFKKDNDNFAEICFIVYRIKKLFDDYNQACMFDCNSQSYDFNIIMQGFGISKSESTRILGVYEKFCCLSCSDLETAKCTIIEEFKGFSKSKLFELLQVDNDQIFKDLQNKVIRYDFTVRQLRDYVKNIRALERQQLELVEKTEESSEVFVEEDIPPAYDPTQYYSFDYFENKNKAQLLNIVWELQKEYEKLKNNYNKLKNQLNK